MNMCNTIKFDEEKIDSWIKDAMLSCQPMINMFFSYRGVEFYSDFGYYIYNGRKYTMLEYVRNSIWWDNFINKKN